MDVFSTILAQLIPYIVTAVVAIGGWLLTEFARWVRSKIHNEKTFNMIAIIDDIVRSTVIDLEKTVRPALSDGKLTKEEGENIKNKAIELIKKQLPKHLSNGQTSLLTSDITAYISSKIEQAVVNETKKQGGECIN